MAYTAELAVPLKSERNEKYLNINRNTTFVAGVICLWSWIKIELWLNYLMHNIIVMAGYHSTSSFQIWQKLRERMHFKTHENGFAIRNIFRRPPKLINRGSFITKWCCSINYLKVICQERSDRVMNWRLTLLTTESQRLTQVCRVVFYSPLYRLSNAWLHHYFLCLYSRWAFFYCHSAKARVFNKPWMLVLQVGAKNTGKGSKQKSFIDSAWKRNQLPVPSILFFSTP